MKGGDIESFGERMILYVCQQGCQREEVRDSSQGFSLKFDIRFQGDIGFWMSFVMYVKGENEELMLGDLHLTLARDGKIDCSCNPLGLT